MPRVTFDPRGRDLRRLRVLCHCSIFPMPMKFIGYDHQGRGWAIYACPVCSWRAGFAMERGQVVMKFGNPEEVHRARRHRIRA